MKILRVVVVAAACGMAMSDSANAQGGLAQPVQFAGGPPAGLYGPPGTPGDFVDAHGQPIVRPAAFCGDAAPYGPGMGCATDCYGPGCPTGGCGDGSCGPGGLLGNLFSKGCGLGGCGLGHGCHGGPGAPGGPFGGAMMVPDQSGPHYFDFSAEFLRYQRDDNPLRDSTIFSTIGIAADPNNIGASNVALSGADLDQEDGNGFRLTGRLDLGGLSVAEFAYSSVEFSDDVTAVNDGSTRLFSVYSLYGNATNGPFVSAGAPVGSDFGETDSASLHQLDYNSSLESVEASFRRYWVGAHPKVSGTVLVGFRYTNLSERLGFYSFSENNAGGPASLSVFNESDNDLLGVQVGGDMWITVLPGLRFGSEGKVGLYNNDHWVRTRFASTDGSPVGAVTDFEGDQVAFLAEAKVMFVADLSPSWSLKGGYEVLFMDELALINEGVATAMPYGDINNISDQAAFQALSGSTDGGDVFYHGFHAGLEYVW